ncbi:MAG: zinc ribbon domain-containing protein [Phycisphaerae bacterium]
MFLFGLIVGVADREKVLAKGIERGCLECLRTTPHVLVEERRQLSIFFLPVWRWNRRWYLVCGDCGRAEPISREDAAALRRDE